jgi:hypothetical protein
MIRSLVFMARPWFGLMIGHQQWPCRIGKSIGSFLRMCFVSEVESSHNGRT